MNTEYLFSGSHSSDARGKDDNRKKNNIAAAVAQAVVSAVVQAVAKAVIRAVVSADVSAIARAVDPSAPNAEKRLFTIQSKTSNMICRNFDKIWQKIGPWGPIPHSPVAMLAQVRRQRQPFVEAGEAPTPPPDTWEADSYKKAEGATNRIAT